MPSCATSLLGSLQNRRFVRFIGVGVLNTAFGYLVFLGGLFLGLGPAVALAIANILGVCFNFFTTGRLVFSNRDNGRIFRFILVYVLVYAGNVGLLKAGEALAVPPALAQLLILPVVVVASFLLMRAFVFREAAQ